MDHKKRKCKSQEEINMQEGIDIANQMGLKEFEVHVKRANHTQTYVAPPLSTLLVPSTSVPKTSDWESLYVPLPTSAYVPTWQSSSWQTTRPQQNLSAQLGVHVLDIPDGSNTPAQRQGAQFGINEPNTFCVADIPYMPMDF
jgi:hypothetical protein